MPRAPWCGKAVYEAIATWADRCLVAQRSLFTDQPGVWAPSVLSEVKTAIAVEDRSPNVPFIEKLTNQVRDVSAEAVLATAEVLFLQLLAESDSSGSTKRGHVRAVLIGLGDGAPEIPPELDEALDQGGVANFGQVRTHRDSFLRFLAGVATDIGARPESERQRAVASAMDVRGVVDRVKSSSDGMAANALLHLLFPNVFDSVISEGQRAQLIAAFAAVPGVADAADDDVRIAMIRAAATWDGEGEISFYDEPLRSVWQQQPGSQRWREAVDWAGRLRALPDFDVLGRDRTLQMAARMVAARDAVTAEAPLWAEAVQRAFGPPNEVATAQIRDGFVQWCAEHLDEAQRVLRAVWSPDSAQDQMGAFLVALPADAVGLAGNRVAIGSSLLLGVDPVRFPLYEESIHGLFLRALGLPAVRGTDSDGGTDVAPEADVSSDMARRTLGHILREAADTIATLDASVEIVRAHLDAKRPSRIWTELAAAVAANKPEQKLRYYQFVAREARARAAAKPDQARYADWTALLRELRLRMLASGLRLRDMLDAQSVAWWLVEGPIPESWSADERAAFEMFRAGIPASSAPAEEIPVPEPVADRKLPPVSVELAASLYLPKPWLDDLLDLLAERRQLVLYGPPGTGKTFIAQALGRHLEANGGAFRLVQFHPSYTYEDFFEGYRPVRAADGSLGYDLVPGALRDIAAAARENPDRPYLLIIDELNRGNVPKIFGEMYFLLEYRDASIRLQYSRDEEEFSLPENLYVVGTMNTADRSIALIDTALRRRFYFEALLPTREPIGGVLRKWLAAHGHDDDSAQLLDELNLRIDDAERSIGPSYFIQSSGRAPNLDRIWKHSILPQMEEYFWGTDRNIEKEFGLPSLRQRLNDELDSRDELDDAADL